MKIIFSLLITIFILYGSSETSLANGVFKKAIKTQEPFVANITQKDNNIMVNIKIVKDAYLYKSFLHIALEPQNINLTDKIIFQPVVKSPPDRFFQPFFAPVWRTCLFICPAQDNQVIEVPAVAEACS